MQKGIVEIIQILHSGGIVAHPADTCYGLAADFKRENAIKKIQAIKGRDAEKPMSLMLPLSMKGELGRYALLDDFSKEACEKLLPGPVTLLLPKGPEIPKWYYPQAPLIGLRIPDDTLTQEILEAFGGPLITTSANLSSQPPCLIGEEVKAIFAQTEERPDLILEGVIQGSGQPSTVILVKGGHLKIVREGPVTEEDLAKSGL